MNKALHNHRILPNELKSETLYKFMQIKLKNPICPNILIVHDHQLLLYNSAYLNCMCQNKPQPFYSLN